MQHCLCPAKLGPCSADGYNVLAVDIGTGSSLDGKTFEEVKRSGSNGVPLAVIHKDGTLLADPNDDARLVAGDSLVVFGRLADGNTQEQE